MVERRARRDLDGVLLMDKQNILREFTTYLDARCRPGTSKVYTHALGLWFAYLNDNEPSQQSAQSYINHLLKQKLSPSTINLRGNAIRRWFKSKGMKVELDFPTSIQYKEPEYLEIEEVEKLITVCKTPLERTLVMVLFDTAVRISELLNLRVKDIDWRRKLISVTRKGGHQEWVNIGDKGLQALRFWLDNRGFDTEKVFGGLDYYSAWQLTKNLGKRSGVKVNIHPHIFRHSRAIFMRMNGAELADVQQHLGHKSITTTANIYGRFKAVDLKNRIPKW